MKNFVLMLLFSGLIFAGNKYSIQVLSVKEEHSITAEFMQKVQKTSLPYVKKHTGGSYKVFVGDFDSYEAAVSALNDVRKQVHEDAFIRMEREPSSLKPEQKMQQAMVMAQARTLQKMKEEKVAEKELSTIEPIKVALSEEKPPSTPVIEKEAAKKQKKQIVGMKEDVKTEEIFCKPTKKALRESEISDAIAFYRASSYYSFSR